MTALLALLPFLLPISPDLSKEEIKRLVEAGISDDVIVAYVRTHGPVQALTTQDLIDLRSANVSEKVLTAMISSASLPRETVTPEPVPEEAPVTYSYPWYYADGYYYDYYAGPYVWWYLGPGRCRYPHHYWYYSHGYYGYPHSLHGYRGGVQPPYHHPVNPPPSPPRYHPEPPHNQPHQPPSRPPPAPHSTPHSAPHGGHR